ncbi:MAG TPA: carbohydrate kinase family protein [Methylomirabilota bacterium]|nr:carbohydrate kinase family protein [Methylomirabilota bacterium]
MTGSPPRVVVIGGANMDLKCRIAGATVMGSSNPGRMEATAGGVARNIAEALARLGVPTDLISAIGRDAFGDRLLAETTAAGVGTRHVLRGAAPTGTYTATLDRRGELVVGVAAMEVLTALTPRLLARCAEALGAAALIVADGNLSTAALDWLLGFAAEHRRRLAIEAVSVPKAAALGRLLAAKRPLYALFCNSAEAEALVGSARPRNLRAGAQQLHERGVGHVGIGLGGRGMLASSLEDGRLLQRIVPAVAGPLRDVTGAGDAAVAGTIYGLLRDRPLADAARFGQVAAALTRASPLSVSPRLSARALERRVRASLRPG